MLSDFCTRDQSRLQFGRKVLSGIFLGYALIADNLLDGLRGAIRQRNDQEIQSSSFPAKCTGCSPETSEDKARSPGCTAQQRRSDPAAASGLVSREDSCDIFPVHLCLVLLCRLCICLHFRRVLGVFTLVITSVTPICILRTQPTLVEEQVTAHFVDP